MLIQYIFPLVVPNKPIEFVAHMQAQMVDIFVVASCLLHFVTSFFPQRSRYFPPQFSDQSIKCYEWCFRYQHKEEHIWYTYYVMCIQFFFSWYPIFLLFRVSSFEKMTWTGTTQTFARSAWSGAKDSGLYTFRPPQMRMLWRPFLLLIYPHLLIASRFPLNHFNDRPEAEIGQKKWFSMWSNNSTNVFNSSVWGPNTIQPKPTMNVRSEFTRSSVNTFGNQRCSLALRRYSMDRASHSDSFGPAVS